MDIQTEKDEKLNRIAREVLLLSRNTLLVNLRFLDAALSQFELYPIGTSTLLTDGKHIFYHPRYVLKLYRSARELPVRDYLHIVMHCVFRHMYMNPTLNRPYKRRKFLRSFCRMALLLRWAAQWMPDSSQRKMWMPVLRKLPEMQK